MNNDILPLFSNIDDFCQTFEPTFKTKRLESGSVQRQRKSTLILSEVMTIIVWFQQSKYRTFKDFYLKELCQHLQDEFPHLVSYNRFVVLMPSALLPLCAYLQTRKGKTAGIAFIDSLPLAVCHNRRIASHKVFAHLAGRGKSCRLVLWLQTALNCQCSRRVAGFSFHPGNVDDRKPVAKMSKGLFGKLVGDWGYISKALQEVTKVS